MKRPVRDHRLVKKLWELDYRGSHAVGWLAEIAPACCGKNRRVSDVECPECRKPITLLQGMAIEIDDFVELLPRVLSDRQSQAYAKLCIDADLADAEKPGGDEDAADPLAEKLASIGWPGRAAEIHVEEKQRRHRDSRRARKRTS